MQEKIREKEDHHDRGGGDVEKQVKGGLSRRCDLGLIDDIQGYDAQ